MSLTTMDRWARGLAWISFSLLRIRRRVILENLEIAFGNEMSEAERLNIGKKSVYHFALTILEFLRNLEHDPFSETEFHHREHFIDALNLGHGIYGLCCHLGNWELMGGAGTHYLTPTYAVVKPIENPGVNRLVDELRNKIGLHTISLKPPGHALRTICRELKEGHMIGMILDQRRRGAPAIPFFGKPARTNTSLATLWLRFPAPIVPGYARRIAPGKTVIEALPALDLKTTGDNEKDIIALTTTFNEVIESMIRRCPEQYFWMHNRWKL